MTSSTLPLEGLGILQPWINYVIVAVAFIILIIWFFKSGLRTMFDMRDRQ